MNVTEKLIGRNNKRRICRWISRVKEMHTGRAATWKSILTSLFPLERRGWTRQDSPSTAAYMLDKVHFHWCGFDASKSDISGNNRAIELNTSSATRTHAYMHARTHARTPNSCPINTYIPNDGSVYMFVKTQVSCFTTHTSQTHDTHTHTHTHTHTLSLSLSLSLSLTFTHSLNT